MNPSFLTRMGLAAFPPHFKARYGEELSALLSEGGGGLPVLGDLLRAAAREWLTPSFVGPPQESRRRRLEATTATVWAWWCFSAVAVAVFARAVDDHRVPGLRSWGWSAYGAGTVAFELVAGLVSLAGLCCWIRVVVPAWRAGDHPVLRRAVLPVPVVLLWLGGVRLVRLAGLPSGGAVPRSGAAYGPSTAGTWALLTAFVVFTVVCVVVCSVSVIGALLRARLPDRELVVATRTAGVVALGLAGVTVAAGVCLAEVLLVGGLRAPQTVMATAPVALLIVASVSALTSAARGIRAGRPA